MPREMDERELMRDEQPLPKPTAADGKAPIVKARVVYLGAMRNKSVSLPGRILISKYDTGAGEPIEIKEASEGGMTCYDFSMNDKTGALIEMRLLPDDYPHERLRRKPVLAVEHLDHMRWFYLEKGPGGENEYEVLASVAHHAMMIQHVERMRAAEKSRGELLANILNG